MSRLCHVDRLEESCHGLLCKPCIENGISTSEMDLENDLNATLAETLGRKDHTVIVDFLSRLKRKRDKTYFRKQEKMFKSSAIKLKEKNSWYCITMLLSM